MAQKYRICDQVSQEPLVWLKEYNQEGLVIDTTEDIEQSVFFSTSAARSNVIDLINSNHENSFIGSVPPPPHK